MAYCCVPGCGSSQKKSTGVSFHELPSQLEQRQQWLKVISRKNWIPNETSNYSRVCSIHFLPTDYKQGTKRRFLLPKVVPSIFPSYPSYKQPIVKVARPSSHIKRRKLAQSSPQRDIQRKPRNKSTTPKKPIDVVVSSEELHDSVVDREFSEKAVQVDTVSKLRSLEAAQWKRKYLTAMAKMKALQNQLDQTTTEFEKYKELHSKHVEKHMTILQHAEEGSVPAILLRDQIKNYGKKRPSWTETTVRSCILLRSCSSKAYSYILENKLLNLPSRLTLVRSIQSDTKSGDTEKIEVEVNPLMM